MHLASTRPELRLPRSSHTLGAQLPVLRPAATMLTAVMIACTLAACGDGSNENLSGSASVSEKSASDDVARDALASDGTISDGTTSPSGDLAANTPPAKAPATPSPGTNPPSVGSPGASTKVNSLDTIVEDIRQRNDFVLKGYESYKNGWYVGPGSSQMGINPSFSESSPPWSIFYNNPAYAGKVAKALLPWVVIFDGVDHAASNAAVEMRNMRAYIKSRSTGQWKVLGGPVKATGNYWGKPNSGLPALQEVVLGTTATGSSIKVHDNKSYFWHGWWGAGRVAFDPNDIGALFVTLQARMVLADPGRTDDRSKAQLGIQVGADYYLDTSMTFKEGYAPAVGINRTKKLSNDWQAFNYVTFSDVGTQDPGGGISEAAFRANPPPLE